MRGRHARAPRSGPGRRGGRRVCTTPLASPLAAHLPVLQVLLLAPEDAPPGPRPQLEDEHDCVVGAAGYVPARRAEADGVHRRRVLVHRGEELRDGLVSLHRRVAHGGHAPDSHFVVPPRRHHPAPVRVHVYAVYRGGLPVHLVGDPARLVDYHCGWFLNGTVPPTTPTAASKGSQRFRRPSPGAREPAGRNEAQ